MDRTNWLFCVVLSRPCMMDTALPLAVFLVRSHLVPSRSVMISSLQLSLTGPSCPNRSPCHDLPLPCIPDAASSRISLSEPQHPPRSGPSLFVPTGSRVCSQIPVDVCSLDCCRNTKNLLPQAVQTKHTNSGRNNLSTAPVSASTEPGTDQGQGQATEQERPPPERHGLIALASWNNAAFDTRTNGMERYRC